jgi:hypothetical protein
MFFDEFHEIPILDRSERHPEGPGILKLGHFGAGNDLAVLAAHHDLRIRVQGRGSSKKVKSLVPVLSILIFNAELDERFGIAGFPDLLSRERRGRIRSAQDLDYFLMKFLRRPRIARNPVKLRAVGPEEKEKRCARNLELFIKLFARDIAPESPKEDEIVFQKLAVFWIFVILLTQQ